MDFLKIGVIPFLFLLGCTESKLSTGSESLVLSSQESYLGPSSSVRIFKVSTFGNPGVFVTELDTSKGELVIPKAIYNSIEHGDRRKSNTPQPLDLIARLHRNPLTSGDFYFEAPVLSQEIEISNTTTAVSWILRWSTGSDTTKVSFDFFSRIVKSVELQCVDCRNQKTSDIIQLVLNSSKLTSSIIAGVNQENPDLHLTTLNFAPPTIVYAWSSPNLISSGTALRDSKEGETTQLKVKLVNPLESNKVIQPDHWTHYFIDDITQINESEIDYQFDYAEAGEHKFVPYFSIDPSYGPLEISISTDDTNRIPLCDSPLSINVRANKATRFNLNSVCRDLDIDETGLTYILDSGPPGLVVSPTGGFEFTAPIVNPGESNLKSFTFMLNDSKLGRRLITGSIVISDDTLPEISNLVASLNTTEGLESQTSFSATDSDGDMLQIRISPIDTIVSGVPTGSGSLANLNCTYLPGDADCEWKFTPSWSQSLRQDSSARIKIAVFYDSIADPDLNGSLELASQVLTLNVTNTDDPPIFTEEPSEYTFTEGITYSVGLGNAVRIAKAEDSPLMPTAISYSSISNGTGCDWLTSDTLFTKDVDDAAIFEGTPPYNSAEVCNVTLTASDAMSLSTQSTTFQMYFIDTNQPLSLNPSAPALYTGKEGGLVEFPLEEMFVDNDQIEEDQRERWNMTCEYDDNSDGIYDVPCKIESGVALPTLVRLSFPDQQYKGLWLPRPGTGPQDYALRISATDKGGTSATHSFTVHIDEAPSAMDLELSLDGINSEFALTANEDDITYFYIKAKTASARPIDQYNYKINAPVCFKIGGGSCRSSLVSSPAGLTGYGDDMFVFAVNTSGNYSDGDNPLPETAAKYVLSFRLEDLDGHNISVDLAVPVTIENKNRQPSSIAVTGKSETCIGTPTPDSSTNDFTICVDASKDSKLGSLWSKQYYLNFEGVDPDTTNDSLSFRLVETYTPGSISENKWTFKLPSCISPGVSTVTRSFTLELADGRGGTTTRTINLKIIKASAGGICMQ